MNFKTISVVSVIAVALTTGAASAATLSLIGSGYNTKALDATYDLATGGGVTVSYLTGDVKNATNGLSLDVPAQISYTFVGSEAGNSNYSMHAANALFTNYSTVGSVIGPFNAVAGLLNFIFGTSSPAVNVSQIANNGVAAPANNNYSIGYKVAADGQSAFLYFDDIAGGDRDFDDLVVKVNIVPVPAAGFLLLGGLGGLAALRRRRARA